MRNFHKRYDYIINQLRSLTTIKGKIVVDCACGVGDGSIHFSRAGGKVIGIDIDKQCIKEGRRTFPNITFKCRSIVDTGLDNESIDIFVCSETLEHLTEKVTRVAAREINRVCKHDAYLCITVPSNKKVCLKNKLHKQFLNRSAIQKHFSEWDMVTHDIFVKNSKNPHRGNRVMIFRRKKMN